MERIGFLSSLAEIPLPSCWGCKKEFMKLAIQLDLFKTAKDSEVDALIDEVNRLRKSLDKVRKGTYSRINIVEKKQAEILEEFEKWKKTICQEKNISYDFQCLNGHQSNLFDGIAMGL